MLSAVLRPEQDAFGRLLMDLVSGQQVVEIVERDDGFVFASDGRYYLAPFRRWWPQERRAMRFVRGRVLDLGCGAGRVSLHLQNRGLDVVGVDVSPMAVETRDVVASPMLAWEPSPQLLRRDSCSTRSCC